MVSKSGGSILRQLAATPLVLLLTWLYPVQAQTDFSLLLEPYVIPGLPGLQSYAAGQYDGKWIILGGRLDGLHLRQPTQSFAPSGNNTSIYVVDPATKQVWSASLLSLIVPLREQLQSTNMQFLSKGSKLYVAGGYGYSTTAGNHITFPHLVVVDMPVLIQSILNGQSIQTAFSYVHDDYFAVTGGQLGMVGDTLLLVGGHRFDGRYTPNNSLNFTQTYTQQIRRFMVAFSGTQVSVSYKEASTDANELHRRDYNMVPQVFPNGKLGYTVFSGVFQVNANLPFLNTIDLFSSEYIVKQGFTQLLNHYHSGKFGMYDAALNRMHSVFLGGMAQYYYDAGGYLVKDDGVPFVSTIGHVVRDAQGMMQENKIGDMPGLLGSGAEFFMNHQLPLYANEVVKLNELYEDTTLAGYLFGGIESTAPNIFFVNNGTQSSAINRGYRVYIIKNNNALPVRLVYFRGQKTLQGNLLQWQMNEAGGITEYEVEHSDDGRQYKLLKVLEASGDATQYVDFLHKPNNRNSNYYRMKWITLNGNEALSHTIVLGAGSSLQQLTVFPNPVKDMLTVELPVVDAHPVFLIVVDQKGQIIANHQYKGSSRRAYIYTAGLAPGVYRLRVEANGKASVASFFKE
jgi:hypothetical protein